MIQSGGQLVLADTTPTFNRTYYAAATGIDLTGLFAPYQAIYRAQPWVYTVVRKLAMGTARLPLKVYDRENREEQRDSAYARVLDNPNPLQSSKHFWEWTVSTLNIFGEAIWLKVRGRDGVPAELWPVHPVNITVERENDGSLRYVYNLGLGTVPQFVIPQRDVVHFRMYNPDTTLRGLSPLEPLRQTLLNEDAARRSTTAFWKNGARPGVTLSHPKILSDEAAARLKRRWDEVAAGPDKTGSSVVLEEGMEATVLQISNDEAQYIETRKLNREEVVGVYDIPPPVVHILDHATFSNITEQMRSMYRDTMAPRLQILEADLDFQLRPDFSDDSIYAEFLMDEVLRGDFEVRMDAYQKAVGSAQMTPNEGRKLENRPPVEGGDRLYINSTFIPIDETSSRTSSSPPAEDVPAVAPLALVPSGQAKTLTPKELRSVMGRLSRVKTFEDLDVDTFVSGLNGARDVVLQCVIGARSLDDLRDRLRGATESEGSDVVDGLIQLQRDTVKALATRQKITRRKTIERDANGALAEIIEEET